MMPQTSAHRLRWEAAPQDLDKLADNPISQANGTYTLSVPNLPGASVTASPLSAAEIALSVKVDALV